jgi:hypothetical protein
MNFDLSVPLPKFLLLLRRKVLVSEKDNTSFRNQQSKFITLLIGKILQLQAFNLSSDVCSKISQFCSSRQ